MLVICPATLLLTWADNLAGWLPPELLEVQPPEEEASGKGPKKRRARKAKKPADTEFTNIIVIRTGAVRPHPGGGWAGVVGLPDPREPGGMLVPTSISQCDQGMTVVSRARPGKG